MTVYRCGCDAVALGLVAVLCAASVSADEKGNKGAKPEKSGAARPEDKLPEDVKKAIAAKQLSAQPGPMHEWLKQHLAGSFTIETSMFPPGGEPIKGQGSQECRAVLGDRFISCDFKGTLMGREALGQVWFAYDNQRKRFVSSEIDTLGTEMLQVNGLLDEKTQVLTMTGTLFSTMLQKEVTGRYVYRFEGNDRYTQEFWAPGPDGKETKRRAIVFTRKK